MRKRYLLLAVLLLAVLSPRLLRGTAPLRMHFIDVGEGESILIETPGRRAILVDTANLISGFRVAEYLKRNNVRSIRHLIFSHPHPDHIGGSFFILQIFNVKNIYDNGEDLTAISKVSDLHRWYETLARNGKGYSILKAQDTISLDGVRLRILWPYRQAIFSDSNTNSITILLEYRGFRCLLTGDLNAAGEKGLLSKGGDIRADILKVGHHGCNDATSEEFLKAVSAKVSIISVDRNNIRGYPSEEVIAKLRNIDSQIYRTYIDGDIVITVNKNGRYSVKRYPPKKHRYF